MTKLSFNATTLRHYPLDLALRSISEFCYDGVEIMMNHAHLHPLTYTRKQVLDIKGLCGILGLPIVSLAAGGPDLLGAPAYEPSLVSAGDLDRARRLDVIRRTVDLAQYIGCPIVNINSGVRGDGVSGERAQHHLLEALRTLASEAGDTIIVLEPEPGFFVDTTGKAIELLRLLDEGNVRLCLDIGHVFCSQRDCYEDIRTALPHTAHIHIEDIKNGVHRHEIPGTGDIDFARIGALLAEARYGGFASVELHHHDQMWQRALGESREYLLNCWAGAPRTTRDTAARAKGIPFPAADTAKAG